MTWVCLPTGSLVSKLSLGPTRPSIQYVLRDLHGGELICIVQGWRTCGANLRYLSAVHRSGVWLGAGAYLSCLVVVYKFKTAVSGCCVVVWRSEFVCCCSLMDLEIEKVVLACLLTTVICRCVKMPFVWSKRVRNPVSILSPCILRG